MWPTINPGELRQQINILTQSASQDASGNVMTMVPFMTGVRAKIEPVKGLDVIRAGLITTKEFLTVTIWWQTGILPNMLVQTQQGTYNIESVDNLLEMNIVLKLNCVALGANDT